MKYIIASHNIKKGSTNNDSGDLRQYFELGWELVISRLILLDLVEQKIIDLKNDIIVTNSSREFLYTKFCNNVISYETFSQLNLNSEDKILDLVDNIVDWVNGQHHKIPDWPWTQDINPQSGAKTGVDRFRYTKEQVPNIVNLNLLNIKDVVKNDLNYICLVVRKRDWVSSRGYSDCQVKEILNFAKKHNMSTYIMGKDCEEYTNNIDVFHISLQEMASLINDKQCKGMISPISGGGMIRLFTGSCPLITFDMNGEYNKIYPLLWGDGAIFSDLTDQNWKKEKGFNVDVLEWFLTK